MVYSGFQFFILFLNLAVISYLYIHIHAYLKTASSRHKYSAKPKDSYSTVLVASNEELIIENTLQNLISQADINLTEIIVVVNNSQDRTFEIVSSFKDERIKIINIEKFIGKATAVIKGLSIAQNSKVFIVDADIILTNNSFSKLASFSEQSQSRFSIGIIKYKRKEGWQSKIIEIERDFINSFLQVARGGLGVATIHGSFSLIDRDIYLAFLKDRILQEDLLLTYELIAKDIPIKTLNEIIAEESDRSKFSLLILQRSRWTVGNIKISGRLVNSILKTSRLTKKIFLSSYPFLWYFMYYSLFLGYLLGLNNPIILISTLFLHLTYLGVVIFIYSKDNGLSPQSLLWCILHSIIFPILITISAIVAVFSIVFRINTFNKLFFRRV